MAGKGREPALRRDQREEVLALYTEGKYTQKQLSRLFGVKVGVIGRVVGPQREEDLSLPGAQAIERESHAQVDVELLLPPGVLK